MSNAEDASSSKIIDRSSNACSPSIKTSWQDFRLALKEAYVFTIFGYSAPVSDTEAINLLYNAWGKSDGRNLEEIEIIDIVESKIAEKKWKKFIYNGHVSIVKSFYDSYMARYPRRSCDAFFDMTMMCIPRRESRIDNTLSWTEYKEWVKPYLDVEARSVG